MKPYTTKPIDIKKYGGLQVAIMDGKVVASGRTSVEAFQSPPTVSVPAADGYCRVSRAQNP